MVKNYLASRWKNVALTKAWFLFISWRTNWLLHKQLANKSNLSSTTDKYVGGNLTHTYSQVWIDEVIVQWLQLVVYLFFTIIYSFCFLSRVFVMIYDFALGVIMFRLRMLLLLYPSRLLSRSLTPTLQSFIFFLYSLSQPPKSSISSTWQVKSCRRRSILTLLLQSKSVLTHPDLTSAGQPR